MGPAPARPRGGGHDARRARVRISCEHAEHEHRACQSSRRAACSITIAPEVGHLEEERSVVGRWRDMAATSGAAAPPVGGAGSYEALVDGLVGREHRLEAEPLCSGRQPSTASSVNGCGLTSSVRRSPPCPFGGPDTPACARAARRRRGRGAPRRRARRAVRLEWLDRPGSITSATRRATRSA